MGSVQEVSINSSALEDEEPEVRVSSEIRHGS